MTAETLSIRDCVRQDRLQSAAFVLRASQVDVQPASNFVSCMEQNCGNHILESRAWRAPKTPAQTEKPADTHLCVTRHTWGTLLSLMTCREGPIA